MHLYTITCASNVHCFVALDWLNANSENDQQKSKMISKLRFYAVMCRIGRLVMFYKDAKQIDDYEEGYRLLLRTSSSHVTATLQKSNIISLFLLLSSRMLRDLRSARNGDWKLHRSFWSRIMATKSFVLVNNRSTLDRSVLTRLSRCFNVLVYLAIFVK